MSQESNKLTSLLTTLFVQLPTIFSSYLGLFTGLTMSFDLNSAIQPIRLKPRRVPFALKPKTDEQLNKLIAQGVLEPVSHVLEPVSHLLSHWSSQMGLYGSVQTTNALSTRLQMHTLQQHAYAVPVISHLLASLAGSRRAACEALPLWGVGSRRMLPPWGGICILY